MLNTYRTSTKAIVYLECTSLSELPLHYFWEHLNFLCQLSYSILQGLSCQSVYIAGASLECPCLVLIPCNGAGQDFITGPLLWHAFFLIPRGFYASSVGRNPGGTDGNKWSEVFVCFSD
jgi:hypothetical protein